MTFEEKRGERGRKIKIEHDINNKNNNLTESWSGKYDRLGWKRPKAKKADRYEEERKEEAIQILVKIEEKEER